MSGRFRVAVRSTPVVAKALRPGLGALRAADRVRITAGRPRALRGSINLDDALKVLLPTDNRWDYGVGLAESKAERVYWIEVHPATEGNASQVVAKLTWLRGWLIEQAPALGAIQRSFVWVASGTVGFSPKSSTLRRLAAIGLRFAGSHLRLP